MLVRLQKRSDSCLFMILASITKKTFLKIQLYFNVALQCSFKLCSVFLTQSNYTERVVPTELNFIIMYMFQHSTLAPVLGFRSCRRFNKNSKLTQDIKVGLESSHVSYRSASILENREFLYTVSARLHSSSCVDMLQQPIDRQISFIYPPSVFIAKSQWYRAIQLQQQIIQIEHIKVEITKAPSTLIRFQTKTKQFCSVLKNICVHSYRFRPSTLQCVSVLKTLLYPQCACSNELDACGFQYFGPRNWRHS